MEPFIGQIMMVGFNFEPRGWAFCDGRLLSISGNEALFSLLGTMYGGDGRTNFALPDLRGRSAVGLGEGPGLSPINIGEKAGAEQITLNTNNMPSHSHNLQASNEAGTASSPVGNYPAVSKFQEDRQSPVVSVNSYGNTANSSMASPAIGSSGGNMPFNNRNPYLGVNYVIALVGIFPSRN
ncbi:microcystin-dependent protein [Salegentibacter sp. 24]|uniref:phage tail protein n=1 Tax=Salegentibacter sp. 24 TaxID=2183986 RepID=UPI0010DBE52E|nr:tail fiber protein [Salegentibacter sp. 24]TDN83871.1 microcystin-dependent protein [Salegentibacter sp. 24]